MSKTKFELADEERGRAVQILNSIPGAVGSLKWRLRGWDGDFR